MYVCVCVCVCVCNFSTLCPTCPFCRICITNLDHYSLAILHLLFRLTSFWSVDSRNSVRPDERLAHFPGRQIGPKLCLYLLHPQKLKILGFIPRNNERLIPDTIETTVPPAKKDLRRQMCSENTPTRSIAGSCILTSRQEKGTTVSSTAVLKPVYRQDGRKAVAEDPPHKEVTGTSSKHTRAGANRNGLGQVFNKESKDQEARTEQPRLHSRATMDSSRPCTEPKESPASLVAGESLRMI